MGACSSVEGGRRPEWEPTTHDLAQSKAIDRLLREEEDRLAKEVKVRLWSSCSSETWLFARLTPANATDVAAWLVRIHRR